MKKRVPDTRSRIVLFVVLLCMVSGGLFAQSWEIMVEEPLYDSFSGTTVENIQLVLIETEFRLAAFSYLQRTTSATKTKIAVFGVTLSGEWQIEALLIRFADGEVYKIPLRGQELHYTPFASTLAQTVPIAQNAVDTILSYESDLLARISYRAYGSSYNFDFTIPWEFWSEVAAIQ
jgi:hypothetical protein